MKCYVLSELYDSDKIRKLAQAILSNDYDEINRILSQCNEKECGSREIALVVSILGAIVRTSGIAYSLAVRMVCEEPRLDAALAITVTGKVYSILVRPGVLPDRIGEATVAFYTFAILHELAHTSVNNLILWRGIHKYLTNVYYDRPDVLAKISSLERFNVLLNPAVEATTNAVTYTYYLAASKKRESPVRYLYGMLPIVPAPGVIWAEYIGQDAISAYLSNTELATSPLAVYLSFDSEFTSCIRDWLSHAVDFDQLDNFFRSCTPGRGEARCWWDRVKYMWNSMILIPTKVVKLLENTGVETQVEPLKPRDTFKDFDMFKRYILITCGFDENTAKQMWDRNEPIGYVITRTYTMVGKSGKQCNMRNKEIVLLCGGAGGGEREGEREGEGGEGREEEREKEGKEGEKEGKEREAKGETKTRPTEVPSTGVPQRVPPGVVKPPLPPLPRPVPPGVGYLNIDELFMVRQVKVRVPVPEVIRRLMGEETRITWKER